jgi:N-acetylmuramoyl-L-alanine amidase
MTVTDRDRDVLARTLWGESRGEGFDGMVAVAWSIRNRVEDHRDKSWRGDGYASVCQASWQYICWDQSDPNFPYLSGAKQIPAGEFANCQRAAAAVIDGTAPDPTGGATHYYATTMPKAPAWAAKAIQTLKLGHHIFFKDVP